jgi:hypothetical protein
MGSENEINPPIGRSKARFDGQWLRDGHGRLVANMTTRGTSERARLRAESWATGTSDCVNWEKTKLTGERWKDGWKRLFFGNLIFVRYAKNKGLSTFRFWLKIGPL